MESPENMNAKVAANRKKNKGIRRQLQKGLRNHILPPSTYEASKASFDAAKQGANVVRDKVTKQAPTKEQLKSIGKKVLLGSAITTGILIPPVGAIGAAMLAAKYRKEIKGGATGALKGARQSIKGKILRQAEKYKKKSGTQGDDARANAKKNNFAKGLKQAIKSEMFKMLSNAAKSTAGKQDNDLKKEAYINNENSFLKQVRDAAKSEVKIVQSKKKQSPTN